MKSLFLVAAASCLPLTGALAQSSFGNITVTGTASVNELDASGPVDLQGNSAWFGSWSSNPDQPGLILNYTDATTGTAANLSATLTRPGAVWSWLRLDGSGNAWGVMELDGSNQLVLTGTQSSSPGSVVIDPTAGQITINGQQVLANGNSDLWIGDSGNIGIGTDDPQYMLDVNGDVNFAGLTYTSSYGALSSGLSTFESVLTNQTSHSQNVYYNGSSWILQDTGMATAIRQYGGSITFHVISSGNAGDDVSTEMDGCGLKMILDSNGNLGIGTSTPQATLDVNGTANISGNLTITGTANTILIYPAGDLSMGSFTNGTPPPASPSGGGGDDDDAMGGFGGGGFGAGRSGGGTSTSGTSP